MTWMRPPEVLTVDAADVVEVNIGQEHTPLETEIEGFADMVGIVRAAHQLERNLADTNG